MTSDPLPWVCMRSVPKRRKPADSRGRTRPSKRARVPARKPVRRAARSPTRASGVRAKSKGKSKPKSKVKPKIGSRPARARPLAGSGRDSGSKARAATRVAKPVVHKARPKDPATARTPRVLPAADSVGRNRKALQPLAEATALTTDHGVPVVDRAPTPPVPGATSATETASTPGLPVPIASFTI